MQWCQIVPFKSVQSHPGLTYIFNFWHSGTLALRAERQSARMSEIKNVDWTWMARCNQLTPLPFKGLTCTQKHHIQWELCTWEVTLWAGYPTCHSCMCHARPASRWSGSTPRCHVYYCCLQAPTVYTSCSVNTQTDCESESMRVGEGQQTVGYSRPIYTYYVYLV